MSSTATGTLQDETGAGVAGLQLVLDNLSVVFDENLGHMETPASGEFSFNYDEDRFLDPSHTTFRKLRLRIRLGRHLLREIEISDTLAPLSFGVIRINSQSVGWRATVTPPSAADTGSPSRVTSGNAVEW